MSEITHSIDVKHMNNKQSLLACSAFIFAVIIAALSPSFLFNYAFLDDYSLLQQLIHGKYQGMAWDVMSGRPGYAILRYLEFEVSTGLESFEMLRFISCLMVSVLGVYIFFFLNRKEILSDRYERVILSLSICLIPSFQLYVSWVTCFPFTLSVILSLASYDALSSRKIRSGVVRHLLSAALIITSFSIYQPAAMCFLSFVFIDNCLSRNEVAFSKLVSSFFITLTGMISGLVMAKFIPVFIYGRTLERASFTHNPLDKLDWFINSPLLLALSNFSITPSTWYTAISTIVIAIGLYSLKNGSAAAKKIILSIILLVGSFTLNLAVSENWAAYRTLIGMSIIATSLFVLGLLSIASKLNAFRSAALIALTFIIIVTSQYNITRGFVVTQKGELQALASELSNKVPKDYTGKVMLDVSNPTFFAFEKLQVSDEFGNISSAAEWALPGMVDYLRVVKGFSFVIPSNPIISSDNPCNADCIVIKSSDALRKASTLY